jgi:hypothetical protein
VQAHFPIAAPDEPARTEIAATAASRLECAVAVARARRFFAFFSTHVCVRDSPLSPTRNKQQLNAGDR